MNSNPKTNQESLIFSLKNLLFKCFSIVAIISVPFLIVSCSDDESSPTGPSMAGNVLISGGGASTEFEDFTFSVFGNAVFVSSIKGADTLLILIVNLDSISVNSAIGLDDSAFEGGPLAILGTFGSGEYIFLNGEPSTGSLTFTALDTALNIAGSFSDGASLFAASLSDDSIFRASIAGSFIASKGILPSSLAKRVRVLSDVF